MDDIEELKLLVSQQIRDGAESRKEAEKNRKQVDDLLAEIARLRAAAEAAAPAEAPVLGGGLGEAARLAAARADKISKIQINFRKSNKVREFKDASDSQKDGWDSR